MSEQGDLFGPTPPPPPRFDGETFEPARDGGRLGRQLAAVRQVMADGAWHTLAELAEAAQGSTAAVSARIRDLRKPRFGGHVVLREYVGDGVWRYRLVVEGAR